MIQHWNADTRQAKGRKHTKPFNMPGMTNLLFKENESGDAVRLKWHKDHDGENMNKYNPSLSIEWTKFWLFNEEDSHLLSVDKQQRKMHPMMFVVMMFNFIYVNLFQLHRQNPSQCVKREIHEKLSWCPCYSSEGWANQFLSLPSLCLQAGLCGLTAQIPAASGMRTKSESSDCQLAKVKKIVFLKHQWKVSIALSR